MDYKNIQAAYKMLMQKQLDSPFLLEKYGNDFGWKAKN